MNYCDIMCEVGRLQFFSENETILSWKFNEAEKSP